MTFQQIKKILGTKTVGIAGCGGLGSNCAMALARVGIGRLILVDFDEVAESNLNRQYYFTDQVGKSKVEALRENISRVNPGTEVVVHRDRISPENAVRLFGMCDVLVEAFDLADQKEMLIETVLSKMPEMPLVIGIGMAGFGMNELVHYRVDGNIYICGDETSEISDDLPPIAPRVGMVANMQANTVVDILLTGKEK